MSNLTNEQIKEILDKCTGLAASAGLCEPAEGYAELPHHLPLDMLAMSDEILALRERAAFYKEQYEKADIECNKLAMRVAELEEWAIETMKAIQDNTAEAVCCGQAQYECCGDAMQNWPQWVTEINYPQPPKESSDD